MILTLTPVPSLDRTAASPEMLAPNTVCNLRDITTVPGGLGVNVAHTLYRAGRDALAVFPAPEISHYMRLMTVTGTPHRIIPVPGPIQMHFTLINPNGEATVLRDPPMPLDPTQLAMLRDLTVTLAENANWVLLAGPLPDIANSAWYVDVIRALKLYHPNVRIVVATESAALLALVRQLAVAAPHVLVLTVDDLEQFTETTLDNASEQEIVAAGQELIDLGVPELLVPCSRNHAILMNNDGAWAAEIQGAAGHQSIHWHESFLAGYLVAAEHDANPETRISSALAYSHAQGSEWDDFLPTPNLVQRDSVRVSQLR
ncbi:MAG: PfkB family carbohydrate kinase [Corynebacterium sp.]|nr:PfkB family carbohydrate kinase [Corynebacterium sp.]